MPPFSFHCPNPDFTIRTLPDGTTYRVNKSKMEAGSSVFQDMFSTCDDVPPASENSSGAGLDSKSPSMEIHEGTEIFGLFLGLLHSDPIELSKKTEANKSQGGAAQSDDWDTTTQGTVDVEEAATHTLPSLIPLPILRPLLDLADKYDISPSYLAVLHDHLQRNAPESPLEVYSLATQLELPSIASAASAFLLSRPMATYTTEEVERYFPTIRSYHLLVRLQAYRKMKLRDVLSKESLFPHGYGKCPKHGDEASKLWQKHRDDVCGQITPSLDVVGEMAELLKAPTFHKCDTCNKGLSAAIDMLQYKVNKVPWSLERVPEKLAEWEERAMKKLG
ncbi:hypothetical protein FS837_004093 [Tulasnella sp. UAMH 9824]|nr:hypothetical protein FS837_004093 [Tulasnella sp. UAMH 9824]